MVVVIISVLSGMIAPRLFGAGGSSKIRESARKLLATAQYARDFAATHRSDCRLMFDPEQRLYALAVQKDPEHRPGEFVGLRGALGRPDRLPRGLEFGEIRIEPSCPDEGEPRQDKYVTFDPTGGADAAVVQITDSRRCYSMLVSPGGGIRVVKGAIYELPNDRWDLDE